MPATPLGAPVLIDGPIPQPAVYNLLTVAQRLPASVDEDGAAAERWAQGGTIRPYSPDVPSGWDPCSTGTFRSKGSGVTKATSTFGAFVAFIAETCTAFNIITPESYSARALAALAGTEPYAAESQLMKGLYLPNNPYICDINATFPVGFAAISASAGLEGLENAIGATARAGVIHADPATVSSWSKQFLVFEKGNSKILQTVNGTPVVSGDGYIGAVPLAHNAPPAARQSWAFATGPIVYQRSDQLILTPGSIREALNRTNNSVTYRAERDWLVAWDGILQAAVLIDRSL